MTAKLAVGAVAALAGCTAILGVPDIPNIELGHLDGGEGGSLGGDGGDGGSLGGGIFVRGAPSTFMQSSATTVTLSLPPGTEAGDYLFAEVHLPDLATRPPGWTALGDSNGCDDQRTFWLSKTAQPGEPSTYVFGTAAGPGLTAGILVSIAGVEPSTPIDATSGATKELTPALPTVVTTVPGDLLLLGIGEKDYDPATWPTPSGMTSVAGVTGLALFQAPMPSPGTTPAFTLDSQGQVCGLYADLVALRPAK
jgi:hypothetical protein